jgi:hypothetical protein
MKKRKFWQTFSTTSPTLPSAGERSHWSPRFFSTLRDKASMMHRRLAVVLLARKARDLGILPLLIEIVRIERGLVAGSWLADENGRLWVWIEP